MGIFVEMQCFGHILISNQYVIAQNIETQMELLIHLWIYEVGATTAYFKSFKIVDKTI